MTYSLRHRSRAFSVFVACALAATALPFCAHAQGLNLTINDVGLAIGDVPRVTGIRLNFRDRNLDRVSGINATIWTPYEPMRGTVNGLALGLPMTGAARIEGVTIGLFGAGADNELRGLAIGGIGVGSGGRLEGIMIGGIGAGTHSGSVTLCHVA